VLSGLLRERDLRREHGLDPGHVLRADALHAWRLDQRRGRTLVRTEHGSQPIALVVSEPRPDVPRPVEAVRLAAREHESAELRPLPLAPGVADDREVLLRPELELLPLERAPARPVRQIGPLRDDALEPLLARGLGGRAAVLERRGHPDAPARRGT